MIKYLLRRVLFWAVTLFGVTNLTFFVASIAMNPAANYLNRRPPIPPETIDQLLREQNLADSQPILERWWNWLSGILFRWDWGNSPIGDPINGQVGFRIGISLQLMLLATIITVVVGVALGVFTASRQYSIADRVLTQGVATIALNTSIIVAATAAVYLGLKINDAAGTTVFFVSGSESPIGIDTPLAKVKDLAQHLVLPTACLVFIGYANYHVLQRALLLDNIGADYVRTARAKGLTKAKAIRKHALRTSLIPVANQVAFSIPGIFTGAALTESLFAWRGMGSYLVETVSRQDVHGIVAVAAFGALCTAIGAIIADVLLVILDPRVRVN